MNGVPKIRLDRMKITRVTKSLMQVLELEEFTVEETVALVKCVSAILDQQLVRKGQQPIGIAK